MKGLLPSIGKAPSYDNSSTVQELGIQFRDPMESFIEMGQSLIDLGVVKKQKA